MGPFLSGFADELVKLGASRKNPYSSVQNQADKLLRGNLSDYIGSEEVRHQSIPSMESVAQTGPKKETPMVQVRPPKIDIKPPKPPK
jgi:hypothetical protein